MDRLRLSELTAPERILFERVFIPQISSISTEPLECDDILDILRRRTASTNIVMYRGTTVVLAYSIQVEIKPGLLLIASLAVHSAWRRRNIGRELLGQIKHSVPAGGEIVVHVQTSNQPACMFLRSQGFKVIKAVEMEGRGREFVYRWPASTGAEGRVRHAEMIAG
jgi:GNAT superfamily N-acetyltransferase